VEPSPTRPTWDEWLLAGAEWAAQRADCSRRKVGALIVLDHRIVSTGFNGALPGERGCLAGGCPRAFSDVPPGSQYEHGEGACISIHAELNAILDAAKRGVSVAGAVMYVTCEPCTTCARLVKQAGIVDVVWRDAL
jgi:dCMP deaminase